MAALAPAVIAPLLAKSNKSDKKVEESNKREENVDSPMKHEETENQLKQNDETEIEILNLEEVAQIPKKIDEVRVKSPMIVWENEKKNTSKKEKTTESKQ